METRDVAVPCLCVWLSVDLQSDESLSMVLGEDQEAKTANPIASLLFLLCFFSTQQMIHADKL